MKERFLEIYKERITRPGADDLLAFLEKSDFFVAPASTKYHLSCPGGLVTHSIHVYERLRELYISERCRDIDGPVEITPEEEESIAICGLLHDVCKTFFYVQEKKSRKTGKLLPNGKPEWEDYFGYSIDDRLPYGHGEKSVYIISGYMKLSREEAFAIRFHMGGWNKDEQFNAYKAFEKYPLAILTHLADMMSTYLDEKEDGSKDEKQPVPTA